MPRVRYTPIPSIKEVMENMSEGGFIFKAFDKYDMIYKLIRRDSSMIIDALVSPALHGNAIVDVHAHTHYFSIRARKDAVPLYCIDFTINKLARTVYPQAVQKLSSPSTKMLKSAKRLTNSYEIYTKKGENNESTCSL